MRVQNPPNSNRPLTLTLTTASSSQLASSFHQILVAGQFLQAHRPARVKPGGADPDLSPKTEFAPVVEPRGGIPENSRRVDLVQKLPSHRAILGNDRVTVMRAIG